MTEKTFILTLQTFVDAESLEKALEVGRKHIDKSEYLIDLVGVMELRE